MDKYNAALQQAYHKYLRKEISYEEADVVKVCLFFAEVGFLDPSLEEIRDFRAVYKQTYRENRRATSGSVETLARLMAVGSLSSRMARLRIKQLRLKPSEYAISSTTFLPLKKQDVANLIVTYFKSL